MCNQTCFDFEWLVVNDGSTDGSEEIVNDIQKNHTAPFQIRLFSKPNEGLPMTINKALDLAQGELLFRVDSDDYALPNAIQDIVTQFVAVKEDPSICGVTFLSADPNGKVTGNHPFTQNKRCNFTQYRDQYHATGDRAEVMRVDVFRKYKFPKFENEKFCPEGVIWNRIANDYDTIYVPTAIYTKTDANDTITSNIYRVLKKNIHGTSLFYKEIIQNRRNSFKYRLINTIKYYRYAIFTGRDAFADIPLGLTLLALPVSLAIALSDLIRYK